jgi:hypothetical protein
MKWQQGPRPAAPYGDTAQIFALKILKKYVTIIKKDFLKTTHT